MSMHTVRLLLADIWDGVRSQKARSGLVFLAILVGSTALALLVGVLRGLHAKAQTLAQDLGANVAAWVSTRPLPQAGQALSHERLARVQAAFPEAAFAAVWMERVFLSPGKIPVLVLGAGANILEIRGWTILAGRAFDVRDVDAMRRVAVVNRSLAEAGRLVPGAIIKLGEIPIEVVGIMASRGEVWSMESGGASLESGEQVAIVPQSLARGWSAGGALRESHADALYVKLPPAVVVDEFIRRLGEVALEGAPLPEETAWITPATLQQGLKRLQSSVQWSAGSVTLLSLVLGGITLMSLMVANVRDRMTEIGLRRAMGATRRQVALVFIIEGVLFSGAASALGVVLACCTTYLTRTLAALPYAAGWVTMLLPIGVVTLLGALFSWWPAYLAAHVEPAEALRGE